MHKKPPCGGVGCKKEEKRGRRRYNQVGGSKMAQTNASSGALCAQETSLWWGGL